MKEEALTPNRSLLTLRTFCIRLIITVLAALMLASCGGAEEAPITVPAGAQAGDLVDLEPCTYEANDIEYQADCGILVVPENRSDPSSRLIAIPIIRVHALGDNPAEPIFYYEGGPGVPNMDFPYIDGMVEDHDIVQVGFRGAVGSVVLECPEVEQAIKDGKPDFLSMESLANIGDAYTRCGARLESEGIDLDGYTIVETVKDSEAARIALGYERINLLGASYGTRLEQIHMWMYPESLHRVIQISVNPPGNMVWEPDYVDRLIEHDTELCAQDPECSARTDDLAETVKNVAHNIPDRWLFMPIDPGILRTIAFMQFGLRGSAAQIYDA